MKSIIFFAIIFCIASKKGITQIPQNADSVNILYNTKIASNASTNKINCYSLKVINELNGIKQSNKHNKVGYIDSKLQWQVLKINNKGFIKKRPHIIDDSVRLFLIINKKDTIISEFIHKKILLRGGLIHFGLISNYKSEVLKIDTSQDYWLELANNNELYFSILKNTFLRQDASDEKHKNQVVYYFIFKPFIENMGIGQVKYSYYFK